MALITRHCRIGSSEMIKIKANGKVIRHCRIGSSENFALRS